ncbi:hypothetical protein N665_0196s0026 [Sinapis alba]|nr:hypothetical protein N665_0196s0026 [Sinapis alba]
MEEGDWYELQNFKITFASGQTRVTRNRYQINLSNYSFIFKIQPLSYCNYYRFQPFNNIHRGLSHPKFSIDLYGALVGVGEIEEDEMENHIIQFSLINIESVILTFK